MGKWLACYGVEGRLGRWRKFRMFLSYLRGDERLGGLSPSQLVEFQLNAEKKDQFLILVVL